MDRFSLQRAIASSPSEQPAAFSEELLRRATEIVRKEMTEIQGSSQEMSLQNRLLAMCAQGDPAARTQVKALIKKIIEKDYGLARPPVSDALVARIYEENYGLGPIEDLIEDPTINEIWVNGAEHIWIERGGIKERLPRRFKDDKDVERVIRLLLSHDGKEATPTKPMHESRLNDGSRLTVLIPPVAKRPCISLRRFNTFKVTTENLIKAGTLTEEMVNWLSRVVRGRANILIIGETSSGKTSLLKWMVGLMNPNLRIGTIESTFELKLDEEYPDRNVFSYEAQEDLGITLTDLFIKCLRSSPDVILLGEARGQEADELIRAMRRGHPGSISTIHTNSPEMAIDDLADMISLDGRRHDPEALRHRIATAIDIIIQLHRSEYTGVRRIVRITEVISDARSYDWYTQDIWRFVVDPNNPDEGEFRKVGSISDGLKQKLVHFGLTASEVADL